MGTVCGANYWNCMARYGRNNGQCCWSNVLPELQPVVDWLEDNYIGRLNRNGSRRRPIFPVVMWNMYDRTLNRLVPTLIGTSWRWWVNSILVWWANISVESLTISKCTIDLLMYCTCSYALCLIRDISVWFSTTWSWIDVHFFAMTELKLCSSYDYFSWFHL